jgi:hypothetical protein
MSRREKPRKKRSKKKLAYGVIAVAFILAFFLVYSFLHSSPPEVAIVDQLSSIPGQQNPQFVNACINILNEGGLTWAYHKGEEVTVDFYRKLPSYGTSLIILRVHSAIMQTAKGIVSVLGLFTSEHYSVEAAKKYPEDVNDQRLVEAFFSEEERQQGISYFGIVPSFIEKSMEGTFKNTIIIMMGCEGLGYINPSTHTRENYTDMADAFVKKGAKVYIGWDAPVSVNHTDQATVYLLQRLISHERTIKEAVDQTNYEIGSDPTYNSTLQYYPDTLEVQNYTIPNLESKLTLNVACTSPTPMILPRFKRPCIKHICVCDLSIPQS